MKPIIKWAGGKGRMLKHILPLVPDKINRYFEPFFGGGAVYLNISAGKYFINDINKELMSMYAVVRDDHALLIDKLTWYKNNDSAELFNDVRSWDREQNFKDRDPVELAARTIYLNKACYGGLYRVNSKGQFNVPYASNINGKEILNRENIVLWNKRLLSNANLSSDDFEKIIDMAEKGDFIFVDPPYFPWSEKANFTSYTSDGFTHKDQLRLRESLVRADKRGVKFVLTNTGNDATEDFYNMFKCEVVPIVRTIAASKKKTGYKEIVVHNM